jgi:hypothetical protein
MDQRGQPRQRHRVEPPAPGRPAKYSLPGRGAGLGPCPVTPKLGAFDGQAKDDEQSDSG